VSTKQVLMIGGDNASIRSALDMAKDGTRVFLVDVLSRTVRDGFTSAVLSGDKKDFDLSLWEEVKKENNIEILSNAAIEDVQKDNGSFKVKIKKTAPRVIEEKCNDCKECIKVCPVSLLDDYSDGLSLRTAVDFFNSRTNSYNVVTERPVCERTCPVDLDIRGYVGLIADGKFKESLALIREKLAFPATIGRVCAHPCEENCNRGKKDEAPRIRDLKRFVADYEIQKKIEQPVPEIEKNGKKVAVIGAGPAGLACAHDLALSGYDIKVFEALPVSGGMLAVGIPKYRLPRDILNLEIDYVTRLGVEIKNNIRIGTDISLDDLFTQGYEAVFIGVGCHIGQSARMEDEDTEGVYSGVDYLRELNLGNEVRVEDRIAIIGGGNVAMDAARSSLRLGAKEVSVLYRRTRAEMPAADEEIEAAIEEGIKFEYLVAPQGVVKKDNKVAGIRCLRMELGEPDDSGRRRPVPIEGSEFEIELDMILPAIGQKADLSFLSDDNGIEQTRWGTIITDPATGATSREGVFSGGDCVTGPWIAIGAIADGKRSAVAIDNYLKGK
jgi:NADPH-dependent glutamate synthase beta subunit-like oxidoreductase/NAD-dependent dihydropyrimidine dehydrogenase PreA subunit